MGNIFNNHNLLNYVKFILKILNSSIKIYINLDKLSMLDENNFINEKSTTTYE